MKRFHIFAVCRKPLSSLVVPLIATTLISGCADHGAIPDSASTVVSQRSIKQAGGAASTTLQVGQSNVQHASTTIGMQHLLTAEYFADGGLHFSFATVVPWLTWAWATQTQSLALRPMGIKTMPYTNPNRQNVGDDMYTNDETTFAHDCNGNRIRFSARNNIYLMNPASTDLGKLWKGVANRDFPFDAVYDDTPDNLTGASSMPCNFNQSTWTAYLNALNLSLNLPVIYNGLGNLNGVNISTAFGLNPSTIGGVMEGCYADLGNNRPKLNVWKTEEDTEIQMASLRKLFICRGLNVSTASGQVPERLYMVGSFLLAYDTSNSIISEKFATPSNFGVEPEDELVPTQPLKAAPRSVADLRQASGAYGREYAACYLKGKLIGACAIIVNSDIGAETNPWKGKYQHTLTLSGGGVLDGGTVSATGPAPPAYIGATSAVIALL